MLRTRVITALALLAGLLPALFLLPPLAWAWLIAVLAALAGWEWGGFMRLGPPARVALGAAFFAVCGGAILSFPSALGGDGWSPAVGWALGRWLYVPSALFWLLVLPFWLRRRWPLPGVAGGLAVGAVVLLPTCLALVQLRQLGPLALLAVMAIVWAADVAAYFAGRAFGKRKLAPNISPGKTWAGAWGAVAGVLVYGFAAAGLLPQALQRGAAGFALILVALTALSIVGDLFESLLKRQAGIKDSSNLLPGHGGILDRIDSQTSTLPFVALLWLFVS
ncbi:phosphatidate cytidylyltransferase [Azospira restricta]|uniref:Phosphatidate cytidylyltransferase n=1 Tax=Azospira restricta TaxID=404405 RepID=A0A974SM34_9RHOO|nr:phosphatidate cytidylyltransferase [Azospira restricta]QRJ62711.1 phosphatidate cytidylyltransferase [Azospira restricta]